MHTHSFNCDDLAHVSRDCPEDTRCCICKATTHAARFCHLSWYKSPSPYDHEESSVQDDGSNASVPHIEPKHSPEEFTSFRNDSDLAVSGPGPDPSLEAQPTALSVSQHSSAFDESFSRLLLKRMLFRMHGLSVNNFTTSELF